MQQPTTEPVYFDGPYPLRVFGRSEFVNERWAYAAGDHVTILGPTGSGKTRMGFDLLKVTAKPNLPAVVLVMKPKDPPVETWRRQARFRRVRSWPAPPPWPWQPQRPPGWVVWPRHVFDPDEDDIRLYHIFRRAILSSYKTGRRIVVADETYGLAHELDLDRELAAVWTRGRSMGCGLWSFSQRPAHIPLHAYSAAQHLLLGHDPDKRARERYAEIGGTDPKMIADVVARLRLFEFLYIRRAVKGAPARFCVVRAD